ncbi:MAG: chloride channel protein [Bacteroidales bacterium]|nr:chloride channel protein [Bacteroidales bacterium]
MPAKHQFLNITDKRRINILSLVVGICCGLAAVVLKLAIRWIHTGTVVLTDRAGAHWLYFVLPGVGMLLSLLIVRYIIKDSIGHGVTKVLLAVSKNDSHIKPHNMWSSIVTSALTIGMGGSVGAEAPIVYTGAAIGSNIGKAAGLSYKNMTLLRGCGAAGAVSGIFNAPLAGVLFTLEILLFNISLSTILPLMLSSVSATVVSYLLLGENTVFACSVSPFEVKNLLFYAILGVACGFFSLYFTRMTLSLEDRLKGVGNPFLRWGVSAVVLGALLFLFPPLHGEGYGCVHGLLNGDFSSYVTDAPVGKFVRGHWGLASFFAVVAFLKIFSMTLTNSGGGVGGTFGPTLFVGAIVGFVVAQVCCAAFASSTVFTVPVQNMVLVGMAATMAAVMQAPMTAIFLIAEICGGYDLLIPLIFASSVSFGTVRIFEKYSIYTKRIAQSGELLTHDNDQAVLTLLRTRDLVRDKYPRVSLDATLGEIVEIISSSTAAVFPVVDDNGIFQGVLDMDDIRKYIFNTDQYQTTHAYNLMSQPLEFVYADEKMESVVRKFEVTEAWRLPVVDEGKHYLGFISKSRILMAYRAELKEITAED